MKLTIRQLKQLIKEQVRENASKAFFLEEGFGNYDPNWKTKRPWGEPGKGDSEADPSERYQILRNLLFKLIKSTKAPGPIQQKSRDIIETILEKFGIPNDDRD